MEALLKTKDVSRELGVNVKTVLKWVNFFGISCPKNELGHYVFRNEDVENLKRIQKELVKGLPMREVLQSFEEEKHEKTQLEQEELAQAKFEKVFSRLDELERVVHQKADEVLSYQVLQHRRELETLAEKLTNIETRLMLVEQRAYKEIASSMDEDPLDSYVLHRPRKKLHSI